MQAKELPGNMVQKYLFWSSEQSHQVEKKFAVTKINHYTQEQLLIRYQILVKSSPWQHNQSNRVCFNTHVKMNPDMVFSHHWSDFEKANKEKEREKKKDMKKPLVDWHQKENPSFDFLELDESVYEIKPKS